MRHPDRLEVSTETASRRTLIALVLASTATLVEAPTTPTDCSNRTEDAVTPPAPVWYAETTTEPTPATSASSTSVTGEITVFAPASLKSTFTIG